jgi:outer membrane protein TolC
VRQEDSVADLQESVRLSNMRYKGGTTAYLEVLDCQGSLFSAELTLAQARHRVPESRATLQGIRRRLGSNDLPHGHRHFMLYLFVLRPPTDTALPSL